MNAAANRAGDWLRELRAPFLPSSAAAVFVGAALAWQRTGVWHWGLFVACLAGVGCLHTGIFQRSLCRLGGQLAGGYALVGKVTLMNAGTLGDPLMGRLNVARGELGG